MSYTRYADTSFALQSPRQVQVAVQRDIAIKDNGLYMTVSTWERGVCADVHQGTVTTKRETVHRRDYSKSWRTGSIIMLTLGGLFSAIGGMYHVIGLSDNEPMATITDVFVYTGLSSAALGALIYLPPDKFTTSSSPQTMPAAAIAPSKTWKYCGASRPVSLTFDLHITHGANKYLLRGRHTDAQGRYIVSIPLRTEFEDLSKACGGKVTISAVLPPLNSDADILRARASRNAPSPSPQALQYDLPAGLRTAQLEIGEQAGKPSAGLINSRAANMTISANGVVRDPHSPSLIGQKMRRCLDKKRSRCVARLDPHSVDKQCYPRCQSETQLYCVEQKNRTCAAEVVGTDGNPEDPKCVELLESCSGVGAVETYASHMTSCYDKCKTQFYHQKCGY